MYYYTHGKYLVWLHWFGGVNNKDEGWIDHLQNININNSYTVYRYYNKKNRNLNSKIVNNFSHTVQYLTATPGCGTVLEKNNNMLF